ncbi:hypothetical protein SAMN05878391_0790 [Salinicoccus kekensis]|uniref:Uncharacterized protein n=1 Tax=Salinicoccus kekensis TaxID=714307 RepID=A0A285UC23_9STAP|nr:hypothetical protein SAMN05878391_0790 [Salinicoccus kekensis]
MTILVKYSDTKNNETKYHLVNNPSETEHIKRHYMKKVSRCDDPAYNMIEIIYPYHTERVKIYELNYRRPS